MNNDVTLHAALKWITDILARLTIPYQIAGGLAARCYGSTREVHDIDIYVPGSSIPVLHDELEEYIEFGPTYHKDEHWDLMFMKLDYKGQQIEFGDADRTKYFDSDSGKWIKKQIDFDVSVVCVFDGVKLPIMPREQLIEYKQRLNRKVDQLDLEAIGK